jgi:hypothetical protein
VRDEWLTQAEVFGDGILAEWPFWKHRILLSNGWELTLHFHDLEVEEYDSPLVPAAVNGSVTAQETPTREETPT